MDTEKMLKSYSDTGKNVLKWNQDLNYFMSTALVTRDSQKILDGVPQKHNISDSTYETVVAIEENLVEILQELFLSSEDIKNMTIGALQFKRKADKCFIELEPEERRVIELRYCNNEEWVRVAKETHYCVNQCINIRNKFIKALTL